MSTIHLSVPADPQYAVFLRSCTLNLGSLANLTLDQIFDLQQAVNEAFTHVIAGTRQEGDVDIEFLIGSAILEVSFTGPSAVTLPTENEWNWLILSTISQVLHSGLDDNGRPVIRIAPLAVTSD